MKAIAKLRTILDKFAFDGSIPDPDKTHQIIITTDPASSKIVVETESRQIFYKDWKEFYNYWHIEAIIDFNALPTGY